MADEAILARHRVELEITFRPCRESDLRMLEWGPAYRSHRRAIERAFEGHRRGDNPMLVADVRGFPVAQIWIDLARREDEGVAILGALRVIPGLQRLGIGRRLVRMAERIAYECGFSRAEIGVEHDSPGARRLYEQLGYVHAGEEERVIEPERPDGERVRERIRYSLMRRELGEELGEGAAAEEPSRERAAT